MYEGRSSRTALPLLRISTILNGVSFWADSLFCHIASEGYCEVVGLVFIRT